MFDSLAMDGVPLLHGYSGVQEGVHLLGDDGEGPVQTTHTITVPTVRGGRGWRAVRHSDGDGADGGLHMTVTSDPSNLGSGCGHRKCW